MVNDIISISYLIIFFINILLYESDFYFF
jgi:hypothetical protein